MTSILRNDESDILTDRCAVATSALATIASVLGVEEGPSPWIENTRENILGKIRQMHAAQPSLFTASPTNMPATAGNARCLSKPQNTIMTSSASESFDLATRAEDDTKYDKMLDKLRGLSGDISPPEGWKERAIRAAHLQNTVDDILSSCYQLNNKKDGARGIDTPAQELDRYTVGDHVSFHSRRGHMWSPGTVTRVESWLRRDGTVGHRVEVSERLDTRGTLRYGCWIYEDGDEGALRMSAKAPLP